MLVETVLTIVAEAVGLVTIITVGRLDVVVTGDTDEVSTCVVSGAEADVTGEGEVVGRVSLSVVLETP